MAAIVLNRTTKLDSTIRETLGDDLVFTGEQNAHKFVIQCTLNNSHINLTGTVTAQFMCPDNATVPINGTIENGKAVVTLPAECYEVPGRYRLSVFNTQGGATVCIYTGVGTVRRTSTGKVVDRGIIPNLNELQQAAQNIAGVENIDITQTKSGNVITVTTTNRNNVQTNKTITEPTATMSKAENGDYTITVTDANGSTSYTIEDTEAAVRKKATIEAVSRVKTALGNPLTITDGMDAPAVKTVVTLEPKQDLHGYDHPWVGGSGKNLLPSMAPGTYTNNDITAVVSNDGTITLNGTSTSIAYFDLSTEFNSSALAGTVFTGYPRDDVLYNAQSVTVRISGKNRASLQDIMRNNTPIVDNGENLYFSIRVTGGYTCSNIVIKPMLRLATESDATYEPYSNICPIEGYDTVQVTATGKNLLPSDNWGNGSINTSGNNFASDYGIRLVDFQHIDPDTDYTFSASGASEDCALFVYDKNHNLSVRFQLWSISNGNGHYASFRTPSDAAYYKVRLTGSNFRPDRNMNMQLERGATATDYEPYQGNTTSLSVAQAAGATVYGGTVTLNEDGSGTLVVDRATVTEEAFTQVFHKTNNSNTDYVSTGNIGSKQGGYGLTNMVVVDNSNAWYVDYPVGQVASDGKLRFYGVFETAAAFREKYAGLQFAYELATPTAYTLTADQLRTLTGKNHVWTDGTKLELTYRADKYADVEKFLNAIPTGTKTGNPAVFADGADDLPFEKLTIAIEPHQEGSGDPSPDNIRPITGWDEVKVTRCGKNLFPGIITKRTLDDTTGKETGTMSNSITTYIPAVYNTAYVLTPATGTATGAVRIFEYDKNLSFLGCSQVPGFNDNRLIINPANANTQYIRLRAGSTVLVPDVAYQLEEGSNPTAYEPYTSTALPISLKYATGSTVYGGAVTINRDGTGSVVVDRAKVDMGTLAWTYQTSATIQLFRASVTGIKTGGSDMAKLSCPIYKWVPTSQRTNNTISQNYSTNVDVMDSRYTDAASFKAAMSGIPLIYELATPTTYTLTAPQLTSLLGNNTVWCDAGQVTVKYKRDIGKALDALEALILEN